MDASTDYPDPLYVAHGMEWVMRVVDLSVPLSEATQVYPGDPVPRISVAARIVEQGFNLLDVHIGSQTGTHIDAPYHFRENGARIDELDLSLFTGPGVLIDVTGHAPRSPIAWTAIAPAAERLGPGIIALLWTNWSAKYGTGAYFDHPYLDADACQRMLDLGVRTFLIDAPSVDETPDGEHPGIGFPVHHRGKPARLRRNRLRPVHLLPPAAPVRGGRGTGTSGGHGTVTQTGLTVQKGRIQASSRPEHDRGYRPVRKSPIARATISDSSSIDST
jgi:kynurenine formamidase